MHRHNIPQLKQLQAIDTALLIFLLSVLILITWVALGNLTKKTHENLHDIELVLEQAHTSFLTHLQLETLANRNHDIFDSLNEVLLNIALGSEGIADNRQKLQALKTQLEQQSQQLPTFGKSELTEEYTKATAGILTLIDQAQSQPPDAWRNLIMDARDSIQQIRLMTEKMESMYGFTGQGISEAFDHSLQNTTRNMQETQHSLATIQERSIIGKLLIIVFLLISRLYFSSRFNLIVQTATAAQRIAEEAVKTKARFLATMSHEIRTPMNGVIGMTRLLMNTPMSKKQTEFTESIRLSGEHLLTVINDVLDFSKIEAGKLDLKRESFELRSCIEEVLNLLSAKALEKKLELAYVVAPNIPLYIEGDMVRLRQILTNLIGNAIKFTDSGNVTVVVNLHTCHDEDLELEFEISDTGCGIPADRLDSVFEQFSHIDDGQTRHYEGTGLGLSISRNLVEMMGGRIWVKSILNKGSRFHFTIRTRATEGSLKLFHHSNIPSLSGKHLLLVTNSLTSAQSVQDFCARWGAKADIKTSAADAINRIAGESVYDIVLVDSNLPEDSALEVAGYVRQRYSKQELPLILIAPPNDLLPRETVRELYNLYLTKPVTRSRLFDSLMTVLGELNLVTNRQKTSTLKLAERLPLTILLAEDNPINQVVASSILDEMGYKIDLAENGRQAIAALHKKNYDVIFMDMQMPEMGGLETTRHIRAEFPPARQPAIIAMTANAMDGDRQECLNAGMNDYISKPVLPEAVEAALEQWCKKKADPLPMAAEFSLCG
ncbi:hybrid sensor histidine kinase/response regulator [Thiothrix nivea]|uniref:Sensory/regulatory protein RpfC n=1 Tax=Thiothrix nivea (strain ATCC 35100 / DSM 5205 / JP2) TaxID=870187 RepID=A0A656HKM5_THINJ|nr:response regulator [Thiothrix nivea]EIJ36833.1 histidine kinase [Thiothrix nivea DSM 5205]